MQASIAFVTASHDPGILAANLRRSPVIASGAAPLQVETGAASAGQAYNRGLDATTAPIVVLLHHDVYLPSGWEGLLARRVEELSRHDPGWAVLCPFGIGLDDHCYGPVWSSSLGMIVGRIRGEPVPVQSSDELMIVLRRSSGLRFDENLPGFHLYGTDIVQTARRQGQGAYAMPLPLIHNDAYKDILGPDFEQGLRYMQSKWRDALPIATPVITLRRGMIPLWRARAHARRSRDDRRAITCPVDADPRDYADHCGWRDLRAEASPPDWVASPDCPDAVAGIRAG